MRRERRVTSRYLPRKCPPGRQNSRDGKPNGCVQKSVDSPVALQQILTRFQRQKRALAEKAARKRMLATVDSAKLLRKSIARNLATRERLRIQRQAALEEKLKQGLAGQRIGRHFVPEGAIDVQLGDELSESLRGLKVCLPLVWLGLLGY